MVRTGESAAQKAGDGGEWTAGRDKAGAAMKCLKCGHEWERRVPKPLKCPRCGTVAWMFPPGVGIAQAGKEGQNIAVESEGVAKTSSTEELRKKRME